MELQPHRPDAQERPLLRTVPPQVTANCLTMPP